MDDFKIEGYDAMAIHSNNFMIAANKSAADMFGYDTDEIVGINARTFFAPGVQKKLCNI